jgi:predicted amidohydrolase
LHLFGDMERAVFTTGTESCVMAEIDGLRLGILICYDVEFPEAVRALALRGAQLVAVPTALMHPYEFVPNLLVRTRAYENQVFLIYANRCGREGDLDYTGLSCIVGPDGQELARAGAGEQIITADLDPALLEQSQSFNTYFQDRRPELYTGIARP